MNKAELITTVADKTGASKAQVEKVMGALVETIIAEVKAGNDISLTGLGTFSLAERAARKGRNPQTGEPIDIPESRSMKFKAGKPVKDALN